MTIVVTGGYGHCGSWVVRELAGQGNDVIIFDRSKRHLSYLDEVKDKIKYFQGDVLDMPAIYRLFKEFGDKIDGIIHFAGLMGGPYFASNPHLHIRINVLGTVNFLEAARIFKKKKFLYISSGSVFGDRSDIPEETDPVSPSDLYGSAKASAEMLGIQYARLFNIDFRAARIYFAYGPGRLPSELYPIYKAIFGGLEGLGDVVLEAGRDQLFDFTYVKDIAKAIVLLYNANEVQSRVYNVASGRCYSVPEILNIVQKYALSRSSVELGPGKIMLRSPSLDIGLIRKELGFEPKYSLEDGIKEYAQWIAQVKEGFEI